MSFCWVLHVSIQIFKLARLLQSDFLSSRLLSGEQSNTGICLGSVAKFLHSQYQVHGVKKKKKKVLLAAKKDTKRPIDSVSYRHHMKCKYLKTAVKG